MDIRDGKIIATPSIELIAMLYADGMNETHLCELFGFKNCMEYSRLLRENLTADEYERVNKERKKNLERIIHYERITKRLNDGEEGDGGENCEVCRHPFQGDGDETALQGVKHTA